MPPPNPDLLKHRTYIEHWIGWRAWPYCPLIRSATLYPDSNAAYLVADKETVTDLMRGMIRIHFGTIWTATEADPTEVYPSWDHFFAAGWRID